jgi:hypothetical protein
MKITMCRTSALFLLYVTGVFSVVNDLPLYGSQQQNLGTLRSKQTLSLIWKDAMELGVGGRSFPANTGNMTYARWPAEAEPDLNPGEWSYGLHSAGLFVQFFSNATSIHLNYTLRNLYAPYATPFANLSPLAASGCDLYAFDNNQNAWRWIASSFNSIDDPSGTVLESPMFSNATGWPVGPAPSIPSFAGTTNFRLHFPNYNGVLSLSIGVPVGASLYSDLSWNESSPIVWLGTSITQGGVVSRPGQAYVSRLSQSLPRPVNNLGLCGSCRLEPGLAYWLTKMPRVPSVLVISCTENMSVDQVATNTVPFVQAVRAAWGKSLPIVLVEPIDDTPSWLQGNSTYQRPQLREALHGAYQTLISGGDTALSYVTGSTLTASADDVFEELTYEGVHPLDRGHALIATAMNSILLPLVSSAPRDRLAIDTSASPPTRLNDQKNFTPISLPSLSSFTTTVTDNIVWTDASDLSVHGRAYPVDQLPQPFARLPSKAHGVVTDSVWSLSLNSAGLFVSFESDSSEIWVNCTLADHLSPMPHFAVSGISGVDLWAFDESINKYRFAAPNQFPFGVTNIVQQLTRPGVNVTSKGIKIRYLLFLSTYNSVLGLQVGTAAGSFIGPAVPFQPSLNPIVWYGTSILQGGVSVKVGNIETARVSVGLNREIYNFGFSGNCHFDIAVGSFLVEIQNPSAIIIDCMWNEHGVSINSSAYDLVKYLRSNGVAQSTPIVLAEGLEFGRNWAVFDQNSSQVSDNAYLRTAYDNLVAEGDSYLHYVRTDQLFGKLATLDSGTAAGLHATDQGMHDMGEAFINLLQTILH